MKAQKNLGDLMKAKFGGNYYKRIGALGGKKSRGGGFKKGDPATIAAGRKGGLISGEKLTKYWRNRKREQQRP